MVYCRNCGTEIDEKAIICPNCGIQLKTFNQSENQTKDKGNAGWAVLGFFVP